MRFTVLAVVASFFSLVVANPAPISDSLDSIEQAQCVKKTIACYNYKTKKQVSCCSPWACQWVPSQTILYCG